MSAGASWRYGARKDNPALVRSLAWLLSSTSFSLHQGSLDTRSSYPWQVHTVSTGLIAVYAPPAQSNSRPMEYHNGLNTALTWHS